MKLIKVGNKEYQLEFTFAAAECRELVQKMFNVLTMSYVSKDMSISEMENGMDKNKKLGGFMNGVAEMVSDIPHICNTAFYAGLLENNPMSEEDSKALMRAYMKENKLSFNALFENLKTYMEDDGFFDLSGLTEMLQTMNGAEQKEQKVTKIPQDHKKPTGTK